jgi:Tol biopolymer transport system component
MDAGFSFTMDAAAARVAWGSVGCSTCHGPVVVLTLATRAVVSIGGKNVANSNPTLSPDGARVAFERRLYDKKAGQYGIFDGLWVAGTNGASLARISADGYCASWSPDGRALAYLGWKDHALRTMRPDGGAVRLLLRAGPSCSVPASWEWSPDSKKIAYIAPGAGRLVVMNVATRATRTVSASGLANVTGFAWSPDSMQLLVTGRPDAFACSSLWLVGTRAASPKLLRAC